MVSQDSYQPEEMLCYVAFCLASLHLSVIRLGESPVTYTRSNKRYSGEKGHRQEIGFLLLSRCAGIRVLPVCQHGARDHFLTHGATT